MDRFTIGAVVNLLPDGDHVTTELITATFDDTNLASDTARAHIAAQSLGLTEYCRQCVNFGLNKQQTWQQVRRYFEEIPFGEFSSLFEELT